VLPVGGAGDILAVEENNLAEFGVPTMAYSPNSKRNDFVVCHLSLNRRPPMVPHHRSRRARLSLVDWLRRPVRTNPRTLKATDRFFPNTGNESGYRSDHHEASWTDHRQPAVVETASGNLRKVRVTSIDDLGIDLGQCSTDGEVVLVNREPDRHPTLRRQ
jgi:hypothetical protein